MLALTPVPTVAARLFESAGSVTTYQNTWAGWYSASTSYTSSSGSGKLASYNTAALSSLTLKDARGYFVSYAVTSAYRGKTLLAIVQGCMGGHRSQSSSESRWRNGFCTIGTQTAVSGLSGTGNLRIGVGDSASGSSDSGDWALFMPLSGNGRGDYSGNSIWAFGSEMRANTGYNGAVYIEAGQGAQAAHKSITAQRQGQGGSARTARNTDHS